MGRRGRNGVAVLATGSIVLALLLAGVAAAHPYSGWTGTKAAFAWQAQRVSCGFVGRSPSVIHAHTRWRTSPANGYVRITVTRQTAGEQTGSWATVQKQRRSTRDTDVEGDRGVVHWTQWFFPFADEAGARSRQIVLVEWFRDRPGADRRTFRRQLVLRPCVVAPR